MSRLPFHHPNWSPFASVELDHGLQSLPSGTTSLCGRRSFFSRQQCTSRYAGRSSHDQEQIGDCLVSKGSTVKDAAKEVPFSKRRVIETQGENSNEDSKKAIPDAVVHLIKRRSSKHKSGYRNPGDVTGPRAKEKADTATTGQESSQLQTTEERLLEEWKLLRKSQRELSQERAAFELEKDWNRSNIQWELNELANSQILFEEEKRHFQRAVDLFGMRSEDVSRPLTFAYELGTGHWHHSTTEEDEDEWKFPDRGSLHRHRHEFNRSKAVDGTFRPRRHSRNSSEDNEAGAKEALERYQTQWERAGSDAASIPWPVLGGTLANMKALQPNVRLLSPATEESMVESNVTSFFLRHFGLRNLVEEEDVMDDLWYLLPGNIEALKRQLWIEKTRWHPDKLRRKVGADVDQIGDLDEMGKIVFQTVSDLYDRVVKILDVGKEDGKTGLGDDSHWN